MARDSVGGQGVLLGVTQSILGGPGVLTKLPRLNLDGVDIRLAAEKDKAFAAEL